MIAIPDAVARPRLFFNAQAKSGGFSRCDLFDFINMMFDFYNQIML